MADNVTLPGTGSVVATDDDTTAQHQYVKVEWGPDGTFNKVDTATGKPLPVQLRGSDGVETSLVDDAAFTPATSRVTVAGFEFDDNTPDSVDEGDAGAARMSANRNIYMRIRDNAGNERGANVTASSELNVLDTNSAAALTALQLIDDIIFTDDAAYTPGASKLAVIGAQADESSTDSVDEGDAGALRMTLARELLVAPRQPFVTCSTDITRPNDTNPYASGDCLSDSTSAPTSGGFTFTSAARKSGGSGIITDLFVNSSIVGTTAIMLQAEMLVFDTSVTNVNDNAALTITDAEAKTVVARIPFVLAPNGVAASAINCSAHVQNLSIGFTCVGSANLRFLLHVKNAYVPAAQEVFTFRVKCIQLD
jgi:hypothetical protein